jgi:hypothetical protein
MRVQIEESTERMMFWLRFLGALSVLLCLGYWALFLLGVTQPIVEPANITVTSLVFVSLFGLFMPRQIQQLLTQESNWGRLFLGCGIGLSVAFFLGIMAFLLIGIDSLSEFLSVYRWEALLLIPHVIFLFLSASISFTLGYRYHHLTKRVNPSEGSLFFQGGLFIAVGIPSLIATVLLFILSVVFSDPVSEILSFTGCILMVFVFIIFIISAILNQEASAKTREGND